MPQVPTNRSKDETYEMSRVRVDCCFRTFQKMNNKPDIFPFIFFSVSIFFLISYHRSDVNSFSLISSCGVIFDFVLSQPIVPCS